MSRSPAWIVVDGVAGYFVVQQFAPIIAQISPLGVDPTPFTAWGVLGLLGIVIIVLVGVIWKLFVKQSSSMEIRDKTLMDFVNVHRGETTEALSKMSGETTHALSKLGDMMMASNDRVVSAFAKQARALDEVLLSTRVLDQIEKAKQRGTNLDDATIEKIVRSVLHERSAARGE